jgi:putative sensor protein
MSRPSDRVPRNPLALPFSGSLWRSAGYLAAYVFGTGWLLFAAGFTAVTVAVVTSFTIIGIPVLAGAAGVLRGCANVERGRLAAMVGEPVRGRYRAVTRRGLLAQASTRWKDPATWRDLAYVVGLWPLLFTLDTIVLTVWLALLAGITMPAWYWAPSGTQAHGYGAHAGPTVHGLAFGYFPHGPYGPGADGFFIGTLTSSIVGAVICLAGFVLFSYVLVATARLHALAARGLLRAPADPLAAARDVLSRPGPIPPLSSSSAAPQ